MVVLMEAEEVVVEERGARKSVPEKEKDEMEGKPVPLGTLCESAQFTASQECRPTLVNRLFREDLQRDKSRNSQRLVCET